MNDWKCNHAPSGCNYPEGECIGACMPPAGMVGPESMFVAMDEARKRAEPVGVEKFTALMVGENHGLIRPFGSDFKGSPEHYQRITVYTHPAQPVQPVVRLTPQQLLEAYMQGRETKPVGMERHSFHACGLVLAQDAILKAQPAAAINEQLLQALKNLIAGYEDTKHTGLMDMQVCGSDVMAACAAIKQAEAAKVGV